MNSKNVYEVIEAYLKENGIKQKFISEKTGIPENTLPMTLQGKRKMDADEFIKIVLALNLDANYFMNRAISNSFADFEEKRE